MEECFYDSPPPNRRLHEGENKEYLPLQASKLKNNMRDRLEFTMRSDINRSDQQKKMGEKRRGSESVLKPLLAWRGGAIIVETLGGKHKTFRA